MRDGITSGVIPASYLYSEPIGEASFSANVSAFLMYAIACNETIVGEVNGKWNAATVVSDDGGHGLFQLTSSFPDNWQDPTANADYAASHFILPDWEVWVGRYGLYGDDLVRAIAASFNAGLGNAIRGHDIGNVDAYTTDNYGQRALSLYTKLVAKQPLF